MSSRQLLKGCLLVGILVSTLAFVARQSVAADMPALLAAQQDARPDGLELSLAVTPAAAQPGDRVTLQAELANLRTEPAMPRVTITLPAALSLDYRSLPSGAAYNVQSGVLDWQPFVAAGSVLQIALELEVNAAAMRQPDHSVTADVTVDGVTFAVETRLWIGVPPVVSAAASPATVAVGQPVQLQATLGGPGPFAQRWDLGDGRHLAAADPTVVYSLAGDYRVTLTADNPIGSATATAQIHVVPEPVAGFATDSPAYAVGQPIQFHDLSGGQPPLVATWDFGDGTSSAERQPIHSYASAGTYSVRLVISNEYGRSEHVVPVWVEAPAPAEFAIPAAGIAGRPFDVVATTAEPTAQVFWNMGDGTILQGAQARHVYWSAGEYLVTVVADTPAGQISGSGWVRVGSGTLRMMLPLIMYHAAFGAGAQELVETAEASELALLQLPAGLSAEEQFLAYINEARRINGLAAVTYQPELSAAAQAHVVDMAVGGHTSHIGTDGSTPAIRIAWAGYTGGYGGEATAWGMQYPVEPVRFWLTSPGHRAIVLSPLVTEVGIGHLQDLASPNIWYWTAEFASPNLPALDPTLVPPPAGAAAPAVPVIELLGPPQGSSFALDPTNQLIFTWSWPVALEANQRFGVYLTASGRTFRIGSVSQTLLGNQYQFKTLATSVPVRPGPAEWHVRLETEPLGDVVDQSEVWPLTFLPTGSEGASTPTEGATATPTGLPATPAAPPLETPPAEPYPAGP